MPASCIHKRLWAVALFVAVGASTPAQAQVTSTNITAPADPRYLLYDTEAAQPATIDIAGTAAGSGSVDVLCASRHAYGRDTRSVARNVPVAANGTFSVVDAALDEVASADSPTSPGETCRLHAVPAGTTPEDVGAFTGPRLAVSKFARLRVPSDADDQPVYDSYVSAAGLRFAADAWSFGSYGLYDNWILDPDTFETTGNGFYGNGSVLDAPETPFYGLEIDGARAYTPATLIAHTRSWLTIPDALELRVESPQFSAANGDLSLTETNRLAACSEDDAYPPPAASCSYTPFPVVLKRTTEFTHDTQVVRVVDRWSSTDGRPHRLDLTLGQWQCFYTSRYGCSAQVVHRFPGETAYAAHNLDSVAGPIAALQPILARDAADAGRGGTAIVPEQVSDSARFFGHDRFGLQYTARTIPATGELTLTHTYVTTRSADETEAFTARVLAERQPVAAPPAPGGGARTVALARPQLARRGRVRVRRAGSTFRVITGDRVSCPAGGAACGVQVTASARAHRVGAARIRVTAGATGTVGFRLSRSGARTLKRLGRLRLTVVVSARAGNGTAVARHRVMTVRLPRAGAR